MEVFDANVPGKKLPGSLHETIGNSSYASALLPALKDMYMKSDGHFYLGIDADRRNCGHYTFPYQTAVFFIFVNATSIDVPGFGALSPGGKKMVIVPRRSDGNIDIQCLYEARLERFTPILYPRMNSGPDDEAEQALPSMKPSERDPNVSDIPTSAPTGDSDTASSSGGATVFGGEGGGSTSTSFSSKDGDGSSCFPAAASVQVEEGYTKMMEHLNVGDRVQVSGGKFSEVFMFTHKLVDSVHQFVHISTASGRSLSLTKGHYIYVNGTLVTAKDVKTGDLLTLGTGEPTVVESVSSVSARGLFNPQTVSGDIIVNGVCTSTYTDALEPIAAHAILAPIRALFSGFGIATAALDSGVTPLGGAAPGLAVRGQAAY